MFLCRVGSDLPRLLTLPDSQNIRGTLVIESLEKKMREKNKSKLNVHNQ